MTDHPMFLEYEGASNSFRSYLGGPFTTEHAFGTLAAAHRDLRLIGLRIGAKTGACTRRIEFMEPVAARADVALWGRERRTCEVAPPFSRADPCDAGFEWAERRTEATVAGDPLEKIADGADVDLLKVGRSGVEVEVMAVLILGGRVLEIVGDPRHR